MDDLCDLELLIFLCVLKCTACVCCFACLNYDGAF